MAKSTGNGLGRRETLEATMLIKDSFERDLARTLNLVRVPAPLLVQAGTGVNDDLNGVERPVRFSVPTMTGIEVEVVQSLAKWKRIALQKYRFEPGEGLYTNMNAIRRDETLDYTHSLHVDQWDWERAIRPSERTIDTLLEHVRRIYGVLLRTGARVAAYCSGLQTTLPQTISAVSTHELERTYPHLSPGERERTLVREMGAAFIHGIGGPLESGLHHDGRAPDYDDWTLNGDIIVWSPVLEDALELSSMGVRVDSKALAHQLRLSEKEERRQLPFHRAVLKGQLCQTIGGGIGQSRVCMFLLQKRHIGEVQAGVWPQEIVEHCEHASIDLL